LNLTVAFISGRRNSSGLRIWTFTWTVAFCRLASARFQRWSRCTCGRDSHPW
jgi:hypothetical protein